ncbi:DgyrCDS8708 [Dimorphilus gyrociliatus]|uniref:DgyrCDS8708 n=1 Tax=Dimorphilus gyrociliatus TaxID=2664684 RepID=A0A7I8VUX7_9ANNE|nr:DgyrCDS8708 [Dimorphilus gyrociliatus]
MNRLIISYAVICFSSLWVWAKISIDVETPRNTHLTGDGQPERITVRLRTDSDPAQCFLQQTKDSTAKLFDNYVLTVRKDGIKIFYEPFLTKLSDSTQELTIDVLALRDSDIEKDEYFGINILCREWNDSSKKVGYKSIRIIRFLILVENNVNEPYFRQIVRDDEKGMHYRLCYELHEKYGRILEILKDEKSNVTVNVQLKKQFIQSIFISTLFDARANLTIKVTPPATSTLNEFNRDAEIIVQQGRNSDLAICRLLYEGTAKSQKDFTVYVEDQDGNEIYGAYSFPTILIDESDRMIITIKILLDKPKTSKMLKVIVSCTDVFDNTRNYGEVLLYIQADSPVKDAITQGDPHFGQIILDKNSSIPHRICYDVSGKSGQRIHILSDERINMSVHGTLMDDYYMHSIQIYSPHCKFDLNTKELKLENGKSIQWTLRQDYIKIIDRLYRIEIKEYEINFEYFELAGNSLKLIISRKQHSITGHYLDVIFPNIGYNYENIGGLIGRIGRNNFIFYKAVQYGNDSNYQRTVIDVNGTNVQALLTERNKNDCWLVDVKDALGSIPLSAYVC